HLLLQQGANLNVRRSDGASMLHLAVWDGHNEIIELLLDHGMDINVTNENGDTALHRAASCGRHIETMRLLIQRGANLQATNKEGDTALWEAIYSNHDNIVTLLRLAGVHPTFKEAIALGDVRAGKQWIADGADINTPFWGYTTPLVLACECGHAAFVE